MVAGKAASWWEWAFHRWKRAKSQQLCSCRCNKDGKGRGGCPKKVAKKRVARSNEWDSIYLGTWLSWKFPFRDSIMFLQAKFSFRIRGSIEIMCLLQLSIFALNTCLASACISSCSRSTNNERMRVWMLAALPQYRCKRVLHPWASSPFWKGAFPYAQGCSGKHKRGRATSSAFLQTKHMGP